MAKRATQTAIDSVIYDKILELSEGKTLRMVIDLATAFTVPEEYFNTLRYVRNIPIDLSALNPFDPTIREIAQKYPQYTAEQIKTLALGHYNSQTETARRDAYILYVFDHPDNDSILDFDPEPYAETNQARARFVSAVSTPVNNVAYPAERRLKQIMDVLSQNMASLKDFNTAFDEAMIELNKLGGAEQRDPSGFRS